MTSQKANLFLETWKRVSSNILVLFHELLILKLKTDRKWSEVIAVWKIAGDEIAVDFQCIEDLSSSELDGKPRMNIRLHLQSCSLLSHPNGNIANY